MKDTKWRMEQLSFYDHSGISAHLEKMASKGWMIEKITNFGWIYRHMEPAKLHFTVSYYPKASEFDPEPTEEQKEFHDFCAHTGWNLACTSAQLQVFYNALEDPVPIETEPGLELQTIHAAAKKNFIPAYIILLLLALLNGATFISDIISDPIRLLSSSSRLFTGFAFSLLFVLCTMELICYFRWYFKAKTAAACGEFLKTPSTSGLQKIIWFMITAGLVYWFVNFILGGDRLRRWVGIVMCLYMPALFLIVNGVKQFLKWKKASRGVNRTLTLVTSVVFAFGMIGTITFGALYAFSQGFFADKGEETYKHGGMTWVIHQDKLPLTVEDLLDVDYKGYIKERNGDSSLLLGQFAMYQYPRYDAENYADIPRLEYSVVIVHFPALYDICKEQLIHSADMGGEYKKEEAGFWEADEAYRLYDKEYGVMNDYLLCYDDILVEIHFGWEPTAEQKAVVGQRLGGKLQWSS